MRQVIVILILLINFFSLSAYAQSSEDRLDAWREKTRNSTFYKIEVDSMGVYSVNLSNLSNLNKTNLKLYRRGEQVAVRIVDNTLIFYGYPNDGYTDQDLFRDNDDFINPYEPIYSRTAVYFLDPSGNSSNETQLEMEEVPYNSSGQNLETHWYKETYRGNRINGEILTQSFNLRQSFSKGTSVNGDQRTSFGSTFRQPRSWSTYDNNSKKWNPSGSNNDPMLFQLRTKQYSNRITSATLETRLINYAYRTAAVSITVGSYQSPTQNITQYGSSTPISIPLTSDQFASNDNGINVVINDNNNGSKTTDKNQIGVVYFNLYYPQDHSILSASFDLKFSVDSDQAYKTTSPSNDGLFLDVSDPSTPKYYLSSSNEIHIPQKTNGEKTDLYYAHSTIPINNIPVAEFEFTNNTYNYNYLVVTHSNLITAASNYSNYRKSASGGGNSVYLAEIEKLFNTFSWGEKNPLAIRNCINLLKDENLEFVLLLGKGLDLNKDPYENNFDQTPDGNIGYHYIPSFGFPGSDVAYSMGLDDELPSISIGRVNAYNNDIINDYLAKVQEFESLPFENLWQKDALLLSGGENAFQQQQFRGYVQDYKNIYVDTLEGGSASIVSRSSDGSTEKVDVSDFVNEGINIMTFYGHSSTSGADIDIGLVSDPANNYNNRGKYPFVIMSGCNGGDFLTSSITWGEDWINTANKGAIGFLAKSGLGNQTELRLYGERFYEQAFQEQIGDHIGTHIRQTQAAMFNENNLRLSTIEQYDLQGDPYLKISPSKVDFALDEAATLITPQNSSSLNSEDDFYILDCNLRNYGKAIPNQKVYIQVQRRYNNGQLSRNIFISDPIDAPYNNTNYQIIVPNSDEDKVNGAGTNSIIVTIGDSIVNNMVDITLDEENTFNNTVTKEVLFFSDKIDFIYPQDLSVTHDESITIYAYDYLQENTTKTAHFQLFADSVFSDPIFEETVTGNQLFKWNAPITATDTTVYYVRVRNTSNNSTWNSISFTKLPNNSGKGWMQSTVSQMQQNEIQNVNLNNGINGIEWSFPIDDAIIEVKAGGGSYENGETYEVKLDGVEYLVEGSCSGGGRMINMVFDQNTGQIKVAQQSSWNPLRCGEGTIPAAMRYSEADFKGKINARNGPYALFSDASEYKMETIVRGDYVLTIIAGDFYFQDDDITNPDHRAIYDNNMIALDTVGLNTSEMLQQLPDRGLAFIGWSRYDMTSDNSLTVAATSTNELLEETFVINRDVTSAKIITAPIGPSNEFSRLWMNINYDANDIISTTINGVTLNETGSSFVFDSLFNTSIIPDDSGLDLGLLDTLRSYDYINLELTLTDNIDKTVAQLQNWRVAYDEAPEGVIINNSTNTDTNFEQGQPIDYQYSFINISDKPFQDSVLVSIQYKSLENKFETFNDTYSIPPILPNSEISIDVSPTTWDKDNTSRRISGDAEVLTFVNSDRAINEIVFNNNSITEFMSISTDTTNPLIEVLFDGNRIISGDNVSPSANVSVSLVDENNYLSLEENYLSIIDGDTTSLLTLILYDEEDQSYGINSNNISIENIGNKNHIISSFNLDDVTPINLIDPSDNLISSGRYTLEVRGKDPSGNNTGYTKNDARDNKLQVDFEIIKEASITNFYPYPNPFSDRVKFVFQITGIDVPEEIKIQIMTVTGRVVKEIFQDELGPIRIGTNISEYAWDGKDEFGDQLANGVYLYRVIIPQKANGTFKHNQKSKDNLFKHNIGKLYLLK
ncbi:C25 family cysteine peptidase [Flammeovirga sp. SubArs3]|uniref:putative type IX secretion system sortase PorU2 n=1 Tax=Flammeovirga sp. SubArs3 TaxID=2995316 RepID=UPI00248B20FE|nr:C25 family cysteine peptidase [Flammeovirga sp. SubArs3]